MNTMRALQFDQFGSSSVFSVRNVAMPVPTAGEVLVRISASSVNPSDVKNVEGRLGATLPRVPGRDFAGTVVSSGPWSGKQVWGSGAGFGINVTELTRNSSQYRHPGSLRNRNTFR
jgi:NADPH:quinone reductase-like Zn-dependent oxidoreductase